MSDIKIGIEIELVGKSEKTVTALNDFSDTIQKINTVMGEFGGLLTQTDTKALRVGDTIVDIGKYLKETGFAIDELEEPLKTVTAFTKIMNAEMSYMNATLRRAEMTWVSFRGAIKNTYSIVSPTRQAMEELGKSVDQFSENGRLSQKAAMEMAKGFSQIGPRITISLVRAVETFSKSGMELTQRLHHSQIMMERTGLSADELARIYQKDASVTLQLADAQSKLTKRQRELIEIRNQVQSAYSTAIPGAQGIQTLAQNLDQFTDQGKLSYDATVQLARGFSQLGPSMSVKLVSKIRDVSLSTEEMIHRLRGAQEMMETTGISSDDLAKIYSVHIGRTLTLAKAQQTLTENMSKLATLRESLRGAFSGEQEDPFTSQSYNDAIQALADLRNAGKLTYTAMNQLAVGFSQSGPRLTVGLVSALDAATNSDEELIQKLYETQKVMAQFNISARDMALIVKDNADNVDNLARALGKIQAEGKKVRDMFQVVQARTTATGIAIQGMGRTMFWAGLGGMFFYMSLSRVNRAQLQVQSSTLSLLRAQMSYNDAVEDLNEMRSLGITNSREYRNAQINLMETELSLAMAEDRLKSAVQQNSMAWIQLALGTFPTLIRTSTEMTNSLWMLQFATSGLSKEAWLLDMANKKNIVSTTLVRLGMDGLTASYVANAIAMGAVTLGLSALVGALAAAATATQLKKSMSSVEDQMASLGMEMRKTSSPAMWQMFDVFGNSMSYAADRSKGLIKNTSKLTSETMVLGKAIRGIDDMPDMNIRGNVPLLQDMQSMVKKPLMPSLTAGTAAQAGGPPPGGITIIMSGPITIRSEEDINILARKIEEVRLRDYKRKGGYI